MSSFSGFTLGIKHSTPLSPDFDFASAIPSPSIEQSHRNEGKVFCPVENAMILVILFICVTLDFVWFGFVLVWYGADCSGNVRLWRRHFFLAKSCFPIILAFILLNSWNECHAWIGLSSDLVSTLILIRLEVFSLVVNFMTARPQRRRRQRNIFWPTPQKQVHSNGPIVYHDQLEVYSNKRNDSD